MYYKQEKADTVSNYQKLPLPALKRIALVAHDNKKVEMLDWAKFNREILKKHKLFGTGTTAALIEKQLDLPITKLESGPLGGDLQIGSRIAEGLIDFLIFFWDPLEPLPHDPDIKALLRLAVVWNIPVACNRTTADFIISSTLMDKYYDRIVVDFHSYRQRDVFPSSEKPGDQV